MCPKTPIAQGGAAMAEFANLDADNWGVRALRIQGVTRHKPGLTPPAMPPVQGASARRPKRRSPYGNNIPRIMKKNIAASIAAMGTVMIHAAAIRSKRLRLTSSTR
ncbi:hypothetical protein EDD52_11721 [Primorskyibacter sedentarius]|uniref:Uncharacterized protein n=1 Tax=Primorskyibacter sedentarius TaxID=745311 RepID=A0A4R3J275_9RHOB|nr:hypothetical protein EDD52_11721 [Primorskyibacter sedentarius]